MKKYSSFINHTVLFVLLISNKAFTQSCTKIDLDYWNIDKCAPKPGYKLVFADECNTFNPAIWDRSSPGDDWPNYGEPGMCDLLNVEGAPMNEVNVSDVGGYYRLRVRPDEDFGACDDISGAEIKTFSVNATPAKSWKILPDSYVEVRYKMPSCDGVGTGFWLYGGEQGRFFEIDINEQNPNQPGKINTNIHLGKDYDHETTYGIKYNICDKNGSSVNLTDHYITFGLELTQQEAKMYINGTFFRSHPFNNSTFYNRPVPFNIRLGIGSATGPGRASDCDNLPVDLFLDYVRVFRKAQSEVVKFRDNTNKITLCSSFSWGDGTNVSLDYYPGLSYTWAQDPRFTFTLNPNGLQDCDCMRWWVTVAPGTPAGTYLVPLTVTLPCGETESKTLKIIVQNAVAPPAPNFIGLTQSNSIYYFPYVYQTSSSIAYEWCVGPPTPATVWERVPNNPNASYNIWMNEDFISYPYQRTVDVCVRAINKCESVSQIYCQSITIPAMSHHYMGKNVLTPPNEVIISELPEPGAYTMMVAKSDLADSYQWSFDQATWNDVPNTANSDFNSFGLIDGNAPSFNIYVRAKQGDTLSYTHSQNIDFSGFKMAAASSSDVNDAGDDASERGLEVKAESANERNGMFYLYNSNGAVINSGYLSQLQTVLNTPDLKNGLYFVLKVYEDRRQEIYKFLKVR